METIKVLVFEDQIRTLFTIRKMLESDGYEVFGFNKSQEALDHLIQNKSTPDLALLDIQDDNVRGVDAEREVEGFNIRTEAGFRIASFIQDLDASIPILFFSGNPERESQANQFKPVDFIDKRTDGKKSYLASIKEKIDHVFYRRRQELELHDYFAKANWGKFSVECKTVDPDNKIEKSYRVIAITDIYKAIYRVGQNLQVPATDTHLRSMIELELNRRAMHAKHGLVKFIACHEGEHYMYTVDWVDVDQYRFELALKALRSQEVHDENREQDIINGCQLMFTNVKDIMAQIEDAILEDELQRSVEYELMSEEELSDILSPLNDIPVIILDPDGTHAQKFYQVYPKREVMHLFVKEEVASLIIPNVNMTTFSRQVSILQGKLKEKDCEFPFLRVRTEQDSSVFIRVDNILCFSPPNNRNALYTLLVAHDINANKEGVTYGISGNNYNTELVNMFPTLKTRI